MLREKQEECLTKGTQIEEEVYDSFLSPRVLEVKVIDRYTPKIYEVYSITTTKTTTKEIVVASPLYEVHSYSNDKNVPDNRQFESDPCEVHSDSKEVAQDSNMNLSSQEISNDLYRKKYSEFSVF